ncbi:ACT domain-containing protein [Ligilactobacillus equi]|uniref:ACT domain-containing protein n=1 Tax=Ligilactobacillus equi TaxID=137357 RepID=UPI002ED1EDFA
MKAILTTVGKDQVGIIAGVSQYLAQNHINILDVSQTIMDDFFTMMMMVDVQADAPEFTQISADLKEVGQKLGVEINVRNAELYQAMHKL